MKRDKQQYKVKINMKQPHTNNKKQKYKQLNRKKEKTMKKKMRLPCPSLSRRRE